MKHPLFAYSQALRLKRICTTKEDFREQSKPLTKRLVERRYNKNEIQQQILNTFTIERAHLLNQKNQAILNSIPLIFTYKRTLPDIRRTANKALGYIKNKLRFEQVFPELPIIAFR